MKCVTVSVALKQKARELTVFDKFFQATIMNSSKA
jgi:hypothetical protein